MLVGVYVLMHATVAHLFRHFSQIHRYPSDVFYSYICYYTTNVDFTAVQQKQEEHSSQTETESSRSSPSTFILDVTDNERQRFPTATDIRKVTILSRSLNSTLNFVSPNVLAHICFYCKVTLHRSTPDKVFGLQLSIRKDVYV